MPTTNEMHQLDNKIKVNQKRKTLKAKKIKTYFDSRYDC
jgi:hypothetical protein